MVEKIAALVAGEKFFIKPTPSEVFEIYKFGMNFTTASAFEAGSYGDGLILVNGIKIEIQGVPGDDNIVVHDFLGGATIKTNAAWGIVLNVDPIIERTNDPAVMTGDSNFVASFGAPIRIVGQQNQSLVVTLHDDMASRVVAQEFNVSGQKGL